MKIIILALAALLLIGCVTPVEEPVREENMTEEETVTAGAPEENKTEEALPPEENATVSNEAITEPAGPNPNQPLVDLIIASYDENDSYSFYNVSQLLVLNPDDSDMLISLLEGDEYDKWTAFYVLSNIAPDANLSTQQKINEAMEPFLTGNSSDFKLMAASVMISTGNSSSIPVLIELLSDNSLLMLSEPPMLICYYSNYMLTTYTEEDFAYYCDIDGPGDSTAWQEWWTEHGERLQWDETQRKFTGG